MPKSNIHIKCKENVTKQQSGATKRLSQDRSIVIKEADKSGSFISMDSEHYKTMAFSILNVNEFYKHLEKNPHTRQTKYDSLQKTDRQTKTVLTKKKESYLLQIESKDSNFYGLRKIHKDAPVASKCTVSSTQTIQMNDITDLKLRPIIARPKCLTQRLSNLIDVVLRPLTKRMKSYLRDTMNFLNHLPEHIPEDTILASFDVESLFSNTPHDLGLDPIKFWLQKHPEDLHRRFTDNFILDSIEFILKNNNSYFNGVHNRQRKGTAMGTNFAPCLCDISDRKLEEI